MRPSNERRRVARRRVIRDSVEGIVWAVPAGSEGAPVEGRGVRQDNRLFLDGRACVCYCFSELVSRPARRFMWAGMAVAIGTKRKWGQAIENKQFWEIAHFADPVVSRTYGQRRETVRFAQRSESFRLCWFFRLVEAQDARERNQRRNRSGELRMRRFAHNLRRESIFFIFSLVTL